ncbi:monocarboxylate transporter 12-like [Amphiura filiformis]|uniref:monocarboxylate transporter 12-like n=1 Tax=Amphiura filiformis TaxID=82378 RepID=UPI003B222B6B
MCIFFGVGWLQTISIYLVPLQEEFGSSSATLGWIVSSGLAVTFLSGPFGSVCVKYLGCRKSCFLGGTILGCGYVASVFAQSPLQLFFTIGMVTGVGCSLPHLSASIATSHYFNKRHALANGLTWLGSSIGQFVSAPFLQLLIDYYGWRGAVLIEGGLVFNTLVAAALFRPIHHIYKRRKSSAYFKVSQGDKTCRTNGGVGGALQTRASEGELQCNQDDGAITFPRLPPNESQIHLLPQNDSSLSLPSDEYNSKDFRNCKDSVKIESKESAKCNRNDSGRPVTSLPSSESQVQLLPVASSISLASEEINREDLSRTSQQASQNRVADVKSNGALQLHAIPEANVDDESDPCDGQDFWRKFFRKKTFFLDSPAVLVVCVVNFLMAYAIQGYYAHVVAKAIGNGINKDAAAFILSSYAIGSLCARLSHGWFIDRKLITPLSMYALALATGCIGAFAAVVAKRYSGFVVSAIVLGMSSGVFYPIIPVVMRSLVGLKRMGSAYGIAMVFDGTGVVTGGLMAGLIKDITGDYNISFIQSGATFAIATFSILGVIIAKKCESRSQEAVLQSSPSPI